MRFSGAGYDYDHHSRYDIDVTLANIATSQSLRELAYSFEHVHTAFQCEAGQKVAIGGYGECGVTPDASSMTVNFEELELIYGKAEQVTTHTGPMTRVGLDEVSNDVNSFDG
jgi:hypothetical protein